MATEKRVFFRFDTQKFVTKAILWRVVRLELAPENPCPDVVAIC